MRFTTNIMTRFLVRLWVFALAVLCSVGCVREVGIGGGGGNEINDAEVILNLKMPGSFRVPETRATLSGDDEKEVKNMWVLIFDGERLVEITKATFRGTNSFSVGLPSAIPGTMVKLVLLANSEEILAGSIGFDPDAVPDKDYADLMPLISASISGPMFAASKSIPMWGESKEIEIKTGVQRADVSLMRSVARIDVGVGRTTKDIDGSFSWNGLTAATGDPTAKEIPFEMTCVYVIKPNTRFSVAPVLSNIHISGSDAHLSAVNPSVPEGTMQFNSFGDIASEDVFRFDVSNGKFTTQDIYIPEANIVSGQHRTRMALVVGGRFASDPQETYYRVDFTDGDKYDNVLRNHLYSFSIMNVMNGGMSSVEEAYNSQAVNMSVDVLDWDEAIINNIWFEGSYYFAIDRQSVVFNPLPGETLSINIKTNIDYFDFIHTADTNPEPIIRLSNEGPWFFDGAQRYGYQFTLTKKDPTLMSDDEYVLEIYNPRDNIGAVPDDRLIDWTIRALNMQVHFHVDQRHSQGLISLENGGARFIAPEGNPENPIPVEIYSQYPVEIVAVDAVTGEEADWIDFGDTSTLYQSSGADYFFYKQDLVIGRFEYGEGRDGISDRTAIINIFIPETGANVNYTVTQQAPYVRIDRETVSAPRPMSGTGTATIPVFVYTNIQPGDLIVTKDNGGDNLINLLKSDGILEQYDPRNPGNRRFEVRVAFDPTKESSYGATFVVSDRYDVYGDLPEESIRVVVPPANQTFDAFWYNATFTEAGLWQPAAKTLPLNESNYVFPWNTSSIGFQALSNIGLEPDPTHMTQADIDRLSLSGPTDDVSGALSYLYTYTPDKSSFVATSNHNLTFTSTLEPDLVTGEVNFKLGMQVFQVGENAYGSRRFIWEGRGEDDPGVIEITDNVSWRADVATEPAGSWFRLRAENGAGQSTSDGFEFGGFNEMDDRIYKPVELGPDENYENSATTLLVNNTELQFVVDPLNFYNPSDPSQPESREATITIRNNDYDPRKLGATNPAPIVITQWNRVLQSQSVAPELPRVGDLLTSEYMDKTYTFTARTNLDPVWLDIWEVDNNGNKVGDEPLDRVVYRTYFDPANSPRSASIPDVPLPELGQVARRIMIAFSAPDLTDAQEQSLGIWSQPSSYPHDDLPFRVTTGYLAPPGVLGVDVVTGQLTLKGSKEYAGSGLDTGSEFGDLSKNTVYVALFKRGSLVGISTRQDQWNTYIKGTDVIWAAPGYDVDNMGTAWGDIPVSPDANNPFPTNNEPEGYGDPCTFADGGLWVTPTASTTTFAGWIPFNNSTLDLGYYPNLPAGVSGGAPNADKTLFMPFIGSRRGYTGQYHHGDSNAGGTYARNFWVNYANNLLSLQGNNFAIAGSNTTDAMPIRCVTK